MKLENAVQIDAPPEVVWRVTEDVANWGDWAPFVESIERLDHGTFGVGSAVSLKQRGLPLARWEVQAFEPGRMFAWGTRIRGIEFVGTHAVIASGTGAQSVLGVETRGLLAVVLAPLLRPAISRSLRQENAGLKAFCERQAAG